MELSDSPTPDDNTNPDDNITPTSKDLIANEPTTDENKPEMLMPMPEELKLENMTEDQKRREKRIIIKNIISISAGWAMVMSAWGGLSKLQSSLHRDEGMGTVNISVLHASLMLSSLILPKPFIHALGHKYTIIVGLFTYVLWAAANGYAVWGTMVPVSILVGLAAAPMWTAQQTYFTIFASRYAQLANEGHHAVVSQFIGLLFAFGFFSGIAGSIVSSTVLRQPKNNISDEALSFCGMNDCPWVNVTNANTLKPPQDTVWLMLMIYISVAVVGLFVLVIMVDQLPQWMQVKEGSLRQEITKYLAGTARQFKNKKQLALIPITMYTGLESGANGAEFTRSYVTCSLGIWQIGFVTIPNVIIHALFSFGLGHIVKYTGRKFLFTFGFLVDFVIQMTLIFWKPVPSEGYVLYIIMAMWGMSDAIWQNQIQSLYAVIFKDTVSAFAVHGLFSAFGWVLAFGYSSYLCTSVKIYILISSLGISAAGYYLTEIWCYKEAKVNYERMS